MFRISVKDLGMIFDKTLMLESHIISIINLASKALGFVIRNLKLFTHPLVITLLYNNLVRSNLEYASIILDTTHKDKKHAI